MTSPEVLDQVVRKACAHVRGLVYKSAPHAREHLQRLAHFAEACGKSDRATDPAVRVVVQTIALLRDEPVYTAAHDWLHETEAAFHAAHPEGLQSALRARGF